MTIKEARQAKNMTQKQLADKLEISQPLLVHYENGSRHITEERLLQIAQALSVNIEDLRASVLMKEQSYNSALRQEKITKYGDQFFFTSYSHTILLNDWKDKKDIFPMSYHYSQEPNLFDFVFENQNQIYLYDTHTFLHSKDFNSAALTSIIGQWILYHDLPENSTPVLVINSQTPNLKLIQKIKSNPAISFSIVYIDTLKKVVVGQFDFPSSGINPQAT